MSNTLWSHGVQLSRPPCLSLSPRVFPGSHPLNWWCHPTISFSVIPFSSCPQSFPASRSFPMSRLFASGDQSTGASASTSVLLMNSQGWFPFGLTGLTSWLSKGLSRVFSSNTVRNHQFFGTLPSLWSNSQIHTRPLGKPQLWSGWPWLKAPGQGKSWKPLKQNDLDEERNLGCYCPGLNTVE